MRLAADDMAEEEDPMDAVPEHVVSTESQRVGSRSRPLHSFPSLFHCSLLPWGLSVPLPLPRFPRLPDSFTTPFSP